MRRSEAIRRRTPNHDEWAGTGRKPAALDRSRRGHPVMAIGDFIGTDPTPTLAQFEITSPRENGLRGCLRRPRRVLEAYALVEPRGFEIEPALHALHDVVVDHPVVAKRNAGGRSASRSWRITRW